MFEIARIARPPEGRFGRLGRKALGWFIVVLGASMILLFTRALVTELMSGTFFGMTLCLMIITFGALVARDGIAMVSGLRVQLKPRE